MKPEQIQNNGANSQHSSIIRLSKTRDGEVLRRVRVRQGEVYALSGESLRAMYHAVEPDESFTGQRVALTIGTVPVLIKKM